MIATTKNGGRLCQPKKVSLEKEWGSLVEDAALMSEQESCLRPLLTDVILSKECFGESIAARLSRKLAREDMGRSELEPILKDVFMENPSVAMSAFWDILAINERDPACRSALEPFLFYKGFMAITTHRVAHFLWNSGRKSLALYFQSISSETFSTDIHPAARLGCGIFLDHATGFVVGETAIIEDNVSILHEVTLGGTGKDKGDRHPIVRSGVLIGAGSKLLGRIEIGECAKIGAGSVVLDNVPARKTVAGVPAKIVGESISDAPAIDMNQTLQCGEI